MSYWPSTLYGIANLIFDYHSPYTLFRARNKPSPLDAQYSIYGEKWIPFQQRGWNLNYGGPLLSEFITWMNCIKHYLSLDLINPSSGGYYPAGVYLTPQGTLHDGRSYEQFAEGRPAGPLIGRFDTLKIPINKHTGNILKMDLGSGASANDEMDIAMHTIKDLLFRNVKLAQYVVKQGGKTVISPHVLKYNKKDAVSAFLLLLCFLDGTPTDFDLACVSLALPLICDSTNIISNAANWITSTLLEHRADVFYNPRDFMDDFLYNLYEWIYLYIRAARIGKRLKVTFPSQGRLFILD